MLSTTASKTVSHSWMVYASLIMTSMKCSRMLTTNSQASISAIGYDFALIYGFFKDCFKLLGKPQNFIQRCVSGVRTMTANNEKQYVEGKIQYFDAVSLYLSTMSIMSGNPKGKPQVIPPNATHDQLMSYDTFFIEINIKRLTLKSEHPYRFGQLFKRNDASTKLFCNETVDHYYIDKVTLMDLIEFYDLITLLLMKL